LPCAGSDDLKDARPIERKVDGTGLCVLPVENEVSVSDFAADALLELGYESIRARDAKQALAELATIRICR